MGLCIGAYAAICPLFISEISPASISGFVGIANQFMGVLGIGFSYTLSYLVPYPAANEIKFLESNSWRYVFIFPAVISIVQLILFTRVYVNETPKYYMEINDMESYTHIMNKIYLNPDIDAKSIELVSTSSQRNISSSHDDGKKSETISFISRLKNEFVFTRQLKVGVCLSMFHQLTGISGIFIHSNRIFTLNSAAIQAEKAAKFGTFCLWISAFIGIACSLYLTKRFKRKIIMQIGSIGMIINLIVLIFFCSEKEWNIMQIIATNFFVLIYNSSLGQAMWVYTSEILSPKEMGVVAFVNMFTVAFVGTITLPLITLLTDVGFYITLTFVQAICLFFITNFVDEENDNYDDRREDQEAQELGKFY